MQRVHRLDEISVGQAHCKKVRVTQEMMIGFTHAIGDTVSFHQNPDMAKDSYFGRLAAPGMLTGSLIGFVLGTEFPGLGTIYVSQDLKFIKPVFPGDEIDIAVTVKEINIERNRVVLDTTITNQDGATVLVGRAEVIPPKNDN